MNGLPLELGDGRYRADELAGEGNFGEVYRGLDTYLDVEVAIKLFKEDVIPDAVVTEARIQARLSDHDHVVSIRDVVLEPPRPFVVMDYHARGSVGDQLERGQVSMLQSLKYMRDALSGLAHAHQLGVIHRDIKPKNLIILQNDRAGISDFGVSEDTVRRLVASRQWYMPHAAPEVIAFGHTAVASDIWAAGCTLFRLLTGSFPFADEEAALAGDFERPHVANRQVPLRLTRIVERALAVDPEDRYPDAHAMLADLGETGVRYCWSEIDDADVIERWRAGVPDGTYDIVLVDRPRGGLEVTATRDKRLGKGPRVVRRERPATLPMARQAVRRWLVDLVQDGRL